MISVHRWFGSVARLYLYKFSLLIFFFSHGIDPQFLKSIMSFCLHRHKIISLGSSIADAHQLIEVNRTTRCTEASSITRFGIGCDLQHLFTTYNFYLLLHEDKTTEPHSMWGYGGSGPNGPPVFNLTAFFLCSKHRLTLISNGVRPGTRTISLSLLPFLPSFP